MSDIKWTKEQRAAIETVGNSLLVSAAAGSGKTAVLAARCAHLVCDANPTCDVDQLLVVTFTEAAAAEMKGRIEKVLRERLGKKEDDPRLVKQLALVERAQVSTLHGFCSRVLRQNFHLLGLDPGFSMLDGDEAKLLRLEVGREMFSDRYEKDADGEFGRLVRFYAGGNDEFLLPHVLRAHEMLSSVVDRDAWIARARERIGNAMIGRLEDSEAGKELKALMGDKIAALRLRCSGAIVAEVRGAGLGKYADYLEGLERILEDWAARLNDAGFNSLSKAVKQYAAEKEKLPGVRNDTPGKDAAKAVIDSVRFEMDEKGELAQMARFTREEWQAGLKSIAPAANLFLDLVEEFGERYRAAKDLVRRLDFNDLERFALRILSDEDALLNSGNHPETGAASGARNGPTQPHMADRNVRPTGPRWAEPTLRIGQTEMSAPPEISPSAVARGYHRQFQHVLVDEYQDINEVQDAILRLVSRECLDGLEVKRNLFCVGDVKQSIYRFRLAEPERFLQRYERFKLNGKSAGEVIDLQANFRSRGPLLEILNQLFVRLMTKEAMDIEYDRSHHLRAGASYPAADGQSFAGAPVELHLLPEEVEGGGEDDEQLDRSEREAQFVARRIRELMGEDGSARRTVAEGQTSRPIQYRDIVILLRSMKFKADQYADALVAAGIPVHREGGQGYFQSMEVRDMQALLTLLDNPRQDIPMAAVLRSPIAGLAEAEDCLARVRLAYPERGGDLRFANGDLRIEEEGASAASSNSRSAIRNRQSLPFHQAVVLYAKEREDELAAALRDFLQLLEQWRQMARHRPLAELIWEIYDQTGYLAFCEGLNNGAQRVANLIDLHQRAAQFGSFSRQGLYRFLKFLESLEAETDFGQPSVLSAAANVVRIMSVHHSKGLEFPVVFLPELGKKINLQDTHGAVLIDKRAGIGLMAVDEEKRIRYPSLASVLVQNSLRQQSLAEELRILYVATTRAKEHLILSGTCAQKKWDEWMTRWSGHHGAMPGQELLGVDKVIDWVGPAVAMIGAEEAFAVTMHSPEEVGAWGNAVLKRPVLSALQEKLARLEPLKPAPALDEAARRVIEALGSPYPHAAAARLEAARSVTDWTKQGREAPVGYVAAAEQTITFERTLATPKCLQGQDDLSAADVGTATHTVLQNLDFSRRCDGDDLAEQISSLVSRKLLTQVQAKRVDQGAIEWFLKSELGARMRAERASLRREMAFYLAVRPEEFAKEAASDDPLDQVMIRGRVDAVLVGAEEMTVIDYKTDRVAGDKVAERAAFYGGQVSLYRRALEGITGRRVGEVYLVFLAARVVVLV